MRRVAGEASGPFRASSRSTSPPAEITDRAVATATAGRSSSGSSVELALNALAARCRPARVRSRCGPQPSQRRRALGPRRYPITAPVHVTRSPSPTVTSRWIASAPRQRSPAGRAPTRWHAVASSTAHLPGARGRTCDAVDCSSSSSPSELPAAGDAMPSRGDQLERDPGERRHPCVCAGLARRRTAVAGPLRRGERRLLRALRDERHRRLRGQRRASWVRGRLPLARSRFRRRARRLRTRMRGESPASANGSKIASLDAKGLTMMPVRKRPETSPSPATPVASSTSSSD